MRQSSRISSRVAEGGHSSKKYKKTSRKSVKIDVFRIVKTKGFQQPKSVYYRKMAEFGATWFVSIKLGLLPLPFLRLW